MSLEELANRAIKQRNEKIEELESKLRSEYQIKTECQKAIVILQEKNEALEKKLSIARENFESLSNSRIAFDSENPNAHDFIQLIADIKKFAKEALASL